MTRATALDLTAVRTGLRQWFANLVGIELNATHWQGEPRPVVEGVCAMLQPIAIRELGQVEEQEELDEDADEGQEIVRKVGGPRVFSLSLILDGYDQRLPNGVLFALESARTKIQGGDSIDALRALGLAFVRTLAVQGLPNRVHQKREYPRATLDIELGYTAIETLAPVGYFEHAQLVTEARDVDGELLPTPPNGSEWVPPLPVP